MKSWTIFGKFIRLSNVRYSQGLFWPKRRARDSSRPFFQERENLYIYTYIYITHPGIPRLRETPRKPRNLVFSAHSANPAHSAKSRAIAAQFSDLFSNCVINFWQLEANYQVFFFFFIFLLWNIPESKFWQ